MSALSFVIWFLIAQLQNIALVSSNEYDTYAADECKRVRRPWSSLTKSERQHYIDGLMELRKNGAADLLTDEFVAIASVHNDYLVKFVHRSSSFFFWHSYILWELESRIRNLGGKYKCFAVPYWDFSTEADRDPDDEPYVFDDIVGGGGDPDNYWTVNGFSWDYTTKQYWVPAHCDAEGDKYPICSFKRAKVWPSNTLKNPPSAQHIGELIMQNPDFADFSKAYALLVHVPDQILTGEDYLKFPVVSSYDPIWYLFHSMVSYHQAIWVDCNDYDLIKHDDLDQYTAAYSSYCSGSDDTCSGLNVELDDEIQFNGHLPQKQWAFIYHNALTVRKAYHFPRWNVIYDLENGDGFFADSHLDEYCAGKLNEEWFMLQLNKNENIKNEAFSFTFSSLLSFNQLVIFGYVCIVVTIYLLFWSFKHKQNNKGKHETVHYDAEKYGTL